MKKSTLLLLWLFSAGFLFSPAQAQDQNPPFWDDIQAFKQQDSLQPPPPHAIVFVGSSSIRMWNKLAQAFPKHQVLNRGFGGSTLPDLKRYLSETVLKYEPAQIIIYSGENDIATDGVQAPEVLARFEDVFTSIRAQLPEVPVVYVSIKPSPSRRQYGAVMQEANALIKSYLAQQPHTKFVDVYQAMLGKNGKAKPEIFLADSLHMNSRGYKIWRKKIKPTLVKQKK